MTFSGTTLPRGARGTLRLRFALDGGGRTVLRERFREGLFHFGKSYPTAQGLSLQILNPTAGLFEGDRLSARIEVDAGAAAWLHTPSSNQVYQMPGEGHAALEQEFVLGPRASLVYWPRWSVLHRRARFRQQTRIELDPTASLFFVEPVSAGRRAHGEFLEFTEFASDLEIWRGGRLVVKERWKCGAESRPWIWRHARSQQAGFWTTAYLVCEEISSEAVRRCLERLQKIAQETAEVAVSELAPGLVSLRVLSESNAVVGRLLHQFSILAPASMAGNDVFTRIL